MNSIATSPHKSLWYAIPVLMVLSLIGLNSSVNLQLYDTYFDVSTFYVGFLSSAFLFLLGLLYWAVRKRKLIRWMTIIHVVMTTLTLVLILTVGLIADDSSSGDYLTFQAFNQTLGIALLVTIISQLLFLLNVGLSLLQDKKEY
ncbi:hypothetical protein QWY85_16865 [Neolewinella lacunae]|uniref:Uncharacterized protein n=1 Tax=Neolewinella lacunae TaxID=1517758 RepID=A0A923PL87_9BACT|nr:hypothetical protein [Neolewinella lacunae]MBC6993349.1 hypothetical protein [Neolewinella lacunae]MDN3636339.1 hypothetical protein [Neolewinella lacunae]